MPSENSESFASVAPLALSPIETMFLRVEEHTPGNLRVAIVLRLDGYIRAELLSHALQHLQHRHPKLRAFFARGSDRRFRFEFHDLPPTIPLQLTEYQEEESPWREVTSLLLQREFPSAGPLIAVAVLRNAVFGRSELVIAMHHAIADGFSAIMVADDLLTEYARAEANSDLPSRPPLSAITVMRAKSSGKWIDRLRLVRRAFRLHREEKRDRQTVLPLASTVPPQSQWVHWIFSREETVRLIRCCRMEQASISGALVAAVFLGLAQCLPPGEHLFKSQFPFNLREALGSPARAITPEDLGCFVSIMNDYQSPSTETSFWDLARRAHQSLETFRNGGGPSLSYNVAAIAVSRSFERAAPRLLGPSGKRVTLLATNYGVINLRSSYGSLRPSACTLMLNNNGDGPSLVMEALVLGQQLNLGLAADQLDPIFWEALQIAVRGSFDAAVRAVPQPQATLAS